ncbi:hypothetical protein CCACVL1_11026 [Corchorus capsularis]|uniref:Uncharacterized protein n=1 Tax=Corchorus capsularis TaxID=210143 RepID=A0A1R3IND6_COCAP|nr:hypothetical protein CCACVL1_11026 [Corchorus capsularis]
MAAMIMVVKVELMCINPNQAIVLIMEGGYWPVAGGFGNQDMNGETPDGDANGKGLKIAVGA